MATPKQSWTDRLADFLSRTPTVTEAKAAVAETEAALAELHAKLAEANAQADHAAIAAAESIDGATQARTHHRNEARRLRDEIHDAETLLAKRRDRLADATLAHDADAIRRLWAKAAEHFARREDAARRADAALVALAQAVEHLNSESSLIHVLMDGKADALLDRSALAGTLRIRTGEALSGMKTGIPTQDAAEIVANQHEVVRREIKL